MQDSRMKTITFPLLHHQNQVAFIKVVQVIMTITTQALGLLAAARLVHENKNQESTHSHEE